MEDIDKLTRALDFYRYHGCTKYGIIEWVRYKSVIIFYSVFLFDSLLENLTRIWNRWSNVGQVII